jgi:hypothetical protein
MAKILIRGEGIAATCCSHLFRVSGLDVGVEAGGRPKVPAVMLGETTQKLLRDVFGTNDLFDGVHRIRRRVVPRLGACFRCSPSLFPPSAGLFRAI